MKDITIAEMLDKSENYVTKTGRTRTLNSLAKLGHTTALSLCRLTEQQIKELPGIRSGATSLIYALHDCGFMLRPEPLGDLDPRLPIVLEDRDNGTPLKETAEKLGLSTARVWQLRHTARVTKYRRDNYPKGLALWQAQFSKD